MSAEQGTSQSVAKGNVVSGSIDKSPRNKFIIMAMTLVIVVAIGGYAVYRYANKPKPIAKTVRGTPVYNPANPKDNKLLIDNAKKVDTTKLEPIPKASYYKNLGSLYVAKKDYNTAMDNYKLALVQVPDDPSILSSMAYVLNKQGKKVEAKATYQKALEQYQKLLPDTPGITEVIDQLKQTMSTL